MAFLVIVLMLIAACVLFGHGLKGLLRMDRTQTSTRLSHQAGTHRMIPNSVGDELLQLAAEMEKSKYRLDFASPKASNQAEQVWSEEGEFFELRYFALVAKETIAYYLNEIATKDYVMGGMGTLTISCPEDVEAWHRQMKEYMMAAVRGYVNLTNSRFAEAYGKVGEDSDKVGLYSLGCVYARLYYLMLKLNLFTTSARTSRQCREVLTRMAGVYTDCCNQLASWPQQMLAKIDELSLNPEEEPHLKMKIEPYVDERLLAKITSLLRSLYEHWDASQPLEDAVVSIATQEGETGSKDDRRGDGPSVHYHWHIDQRILICVLGDWVDEQNNYYK